MSRYRLVRQLVIFFSIVLVLATALLGPIPPTPFELLTQLIYIPVIVAALFWGRTGGLVAGLVGGTAYLAAMIGVYLAVADAGLPPSDRVVLLATQAGFFVFVGWAGGTVFDQVRRGFERLEESILVDEATGLLNERSFYQRLQEELLRAQRYPAPFAVITVDFRHFQGLRRSQRDRVLKECYEKVSRRVVDLAFRRHDELVLLLPQTDREGGDAFVARMVDELQEESLVGDSPSAAPLIHLITFPEDKPKIWDLVAEHIVGEARNEFELIPA